MDQTAEGKTFVVTGANTGLGRATVEALAARGAQRIVIASRSREKTQPVLDALAAAHPRTEVKFVALEMGALDAVKRAAAEVLALDVPVDALINNAGIAAVRGLTQDGFELTFGTNHLAHFAWTEALLPLVVRARGRIVNVASDGHYQASGVAWERLRETTSVSGLPEYFVSKLCNVLYANELARRLAGTGVTTYALHPGGVASDIWQRRLGVFAKLILPFLLTVEKGARTQVWCATEPSLATETGLYYSNQKKKRPNPVALDVALQDELTARSRAWTA